VITGNVGIIVDSELNRLTEFRQPLIEGFFLPANFELLYASAERGTEEYIANAAIANCDRIATRLLARLRRKQVAGEYKEGDNKTYRRSRY
jgi:hypothetical protein